MKTKTAFQERLDALANSVVEQAQLEFLTRAAASRDDEIDDEELERLGEWFYGFMLTAAAISSMFEGHLEIHFREGRAEPTWSVSEAGEKAVEAMGGKRKKRPGPLGAQRHGPRAQHSQE